MKNKKVYTGVHGREKIMAAAVGLLSNEAVYRSEDQVQNGAAVLIPVYDKKPLPGKSFVQDIINTQHVKEAVNAFDKHLADNTRKALASLDYTFESEGDFKLFCRDRLTVVSFEDNEFRKEMYLDLKSPEEPGTLLFRFSTEITTKYENGVLTTTFG